MSTCLYCDRPASYGWSGNSHAYHTCVMCAITRLSSRLAADAALLAALARGDTTLRAAARARGMTPAELKERLYGSR